MKFYLVTVQEGGLGHPYGNLFQILVQGNSTSVRLVAGVDLWSLKTLLVPQRNGSRLLQISGVKSGPIRSESTEYRDCHIESHSHPLMAERLCISWVQCTMCDSKCEALSVSSRCHIMSECACIKKFIIFFSVPRIKYVQQQKTTPCDTIKILFLSFHLQCWLPH